MLNVYKTADFFTEISFPIFHLKICENILKIKKTC